MMLASLAKFRKPSLLLRVCKGARSPTVTTVNQLNLRLWLGHLHSESRASLSRKLWSRLARSTSTGNRQSDKRKEGVSGPAGWRGWTAASSLPLNNCAY